MIGFGFSPSYQILLGLRIILGVFEAGYFPGSVYLLYVPNRHFERPTYMVETL